MRGRLTSVACVALACLWAAQAAGAACPRAADGDDCDWVGTPSYISGTSVYSHGEFVYSDYVHDDYGANVDGFHSNDPDPPQPITGVYPNMQDLTSPRFGGTANNGMERFRHSGDYGYPAAGPAGAPTGYYDVADVLEFREALSGDHHLHVLARLGAMTAPDSTVVGIGIDADRDTATGASSWPRGAAMDQSLGYEYFITLWGTGGEIVDYTKSPPVTTPVKVAANVKARPAFMEADVPLPGSASPGRWRTYVGAGMWDAGAKAWRTALPTGSQTGSPGSLSRGPNIYNLLFRAHEANNWWRDTTQADDLALHDISADHADIDMKMLAGGRSGPVPHPTGLLNVQYRTMALGDGQGTESSAAVFVPIGNEIYKGVIQPYALVLPSQYYSEPHPRRFVFFYHCANCNHMIWPFGVESSATPNRNTVADSAVDATHIQQIVDRNDVMIGGSVQRGEVGPGATYGNIPGAGERDLRDVYDALRTRDGYDVDPNKVVFSGMSMGGSTTNTMMTLYPDELAAAISHSASSTPARLKNIRNVYYMQITGDTGLDSTASTSGRQAAGALDDLGYRHMYIEYLGRAHDFSLVYESLPIVEKTGWREDRDPNPARVTYQLDRAVEEPDAKVGLSHDHAYWTNGLKIASGAASGTIDAIALPLADKLPKTTSHLEGTFVNTDTGNQTYVDWMEWNRDLTDHGLQDFQPGWTPQGDVTVTNAKVPAPEHAGENAFSAKTSDLSTATLDLARMKVATDSRVTGYLDAGKPLALSLATGGLGPPRVATLDDKAVAVSMQGDAVAVDIPAGKHTLVLDGWPAVSVRSARACASRRAFRIRLGVRRRVHLLSARVYVNGRRVRVLRGKRLRAPVNLRGLRRGRFTVTIKGRTRGGRTYVAHRHYRTCAAKRRKKR